MKKAHRLIEEGHVKEKSLYRYNTIPDTRVGAK
jgi:hypothetical protein